MRRKTLNENCVYALVRILPFNDCAAADDGGGIAGDDVGVRERDEKRSN